MLFGKTTAQKKLEYDPARKQPVIKCSICNGEQVAGLRDLRTGRFEEIMTIRDSADLRVFREMCGAEEIRKVY